MISLKFKEGCVETQLLADKKFERGVGRLKLESLRVPEP